MRIVYHHRTRSTDAQRIHIQEIVRAFEDLGHQVEVVSLVPLDAGQHNAERDAGDALWKRLVRKIPFAYELAQLGYNLVGVPMLLRSLLRKRADFLYERYALFNFAGLIAAWLFRIPLILEVNSPFALEQARDREIRALRFAAWTERFLCNHAARVIVVSTPLARLLEQAGVAAGKIEVMVNGVSLDDFQPGAASDELRQRLGIAGRLVIGFVGWFRKWHGLELLLEAFLHSGLGSRGVRLLLLGDGPAMAELREFAAQHQMGESVVFPGPVPHAAVPAYLDLIDVAVQPAANEYCCPMKILEYMALGKPVIAPAQENILELLSKEEACFFTPRDVASLSAALLTMAGDRERARRMGMAARTAIEERGFLWSENARRVIAMMAQEPSAAPAVEPALGVSQREPQA